MYPQNDIWPVWPCRPCGVDVRKCITHPCCTWKVETANSVAYCWHIRHAWSDHEYSNSICGTTSCTTSPQQIEPVEFEPDVWWLVHSLLVCYIWYSEDGVWVGGRGYSPATLWRWFARQFNNFFRWHANVISSLLVRWWEITLTVQRE